MGGLFSLAPLREDGEEGTTRRTDKNGRKGTGLRWKQESAHHRGHLAIDDLGALSLRPSRRAPFEPGRVYATVEMVDP